MTPLYPQKLALTSPTGGGSSVGIVRSRTKATEFSLVLVLLHLPYSPELTPSDYHLFGPFKSAVGTPLLQ